jgi:aldehyde:ferredoxin oxidoreductase
MNGINGKILRINLSSSSIHSEEIEEDIFRLFPGGKALASYYLLKELPAGVDPLSPENLLVFATGLLTGAPVATASRFTVASRSPLTLGYGESEAGGYWGTELKATGFDAILVTGRAPQPVYLWIDDGVPCLLDAKHLWGRDPLEVQEEIRRVHGDNHIRVLQIGKGGEHQVRYASITNELRHFNGRTGMGAVMGSKNLKAIAVRGRNRYSRLAFDPTALSKLGNKVAKRMKEHPQSWELYEKGTPGLVSALNDAGILPTHNFHGGSFTGAEHLNWTNYQDKIFAGRWTCYGCTVKCKREVYVNNKVSPYGGPEYETLGAFGSCCCIEDITAVAQANELCNRYTLDTISTGMTIAFAMECFEKGLLTKQDTDGLELTFGNAPAMLEAIELIAKREGFGALLAEGSRRLAEWIGGEAPDFTLEVKGQEFPMHDPRGKVGVGLGYAVSEIGADHLVSFHDPLFANPGSIPFSSAQSLGEILPLPVFELSARKAFQYLIFEKWASFGKTAGLCYFGPAPRSFISVEEVLEIVNAATGWGLEIEDLLVIGERATNAARLFNLREGFNSTHDRLPVRMFQPLETGPLVGRAISEDEFKCALSMLYEYKGWDSQGSPTLEKLQMLGLDAFG